MTDVLQGWVRAWEQTGARVLELGRGLEPAQCARPTDLPGWTVHDVLSHLAAIESDLAGTGSPPAAGPDRVGGAGFTAYTAAGVEARRGRSTAEVLDELEQAMARRAAELAADPPADPAGTPPRLPGGVRWDWSTLLRNRVVDLWMHEQDVRRAVGSPGDLDGPGARVALGTFAASLPYVVGKRVAPPPGTTLLLTITGPVPFEGAVRVGEDGRAVPIPPARGDATAEVGDGGPDVRLRMSGETFAVLSGGRRGTDEVEVQVTGDADLARQVLAAMAVTP